MKNAPSRGIYTSSTQTMKTYYANTTTVEVLNTTGKKAMRRLKKRSKRLNPIRAVANSFDNLLCLTTRFLEGDFKAANKAMDAFAMYVIIFGSLYLLIHLILFIF